MKDIREKSGMFAQVYNIILKIPEGRVATYGQIAMMIGRPRAARFVGYALRQAPYGLPCHRVVNRLGEMAPEGVFGSGELQRQRLESEGISFLENGCIDLKRYLWRGTQEE